MLPAIKGGRPVRDHFLPYGQQWISADDVQAVAEVLRSDWLTTGPTVEAFEERFAACVDSWFCVAVSNGTAALHAAAFAAGIGPGDEVITTPMTFAASANCVLYQGGKPVFADVHPDTLNIDPARVEEQVTPQTRALVVVDYAGLPCDLAELRDIAQRHDLVLVEDAAHALGATYRGQRIGTQSDLTTFSLHPVKHITTGEGGAITTNNPERARQMKSFRNHGITTSAREREAQGDWFYEMAYLGYNYRLTDVQCALGLSQLARLDEFLQRRREIAARYDRELDDLPLTLPARLPDRESAWHLYVVRLNLEALHADRRQIFAALRAENIGVNVHYIPVYWHPYYRDTLAYGRGLCPVAEAEYGRLLSLPMFPKMTDKDVSDVVEALHKVLSFYGR